MMSALIASGNARPQCASARDADSLPSPCSQASRQLPRHCRGAERIVAVKVAPLLQAVASGVQAGRVTTVPLGIEFVLVLVRFVFEVVHHAVRENCALSLYQHESDR